MTMVEFLWRVVVTLGCIFLLLLLAYSLSRIIGAGWFRSKSEYDRSIDRGDSKKTP